MPLPMVHLAVAVRICGLEGANPSPDFLLGSIAPDAIHMRPGTSRIDKLRVHLTETADPHNERLRELLAHAEPQSMQTTGFAMGYITHILTDQQWTVTVGDSFRRSIPPDLSPQELSALYYQETDQVDIGLYRKVPWRLEVWSKLAAAQPKDFFTLLTADEIARWRDRTLAWYDDPAHDPRITPAHITGEDVNEFIVQAAERILATYRAWASS
ncbi:MAG: zinc dependent phospholipase C family protein [Anaerolineae bacterium]